MALSSDQSKLIVSVSNGSCIVYNASNLDKPLAGTFKNVQAVGNNKVALVSAPVSGGGNSFYVGSSNGTVNLIGQYGLDRNLGRTSGNLFSVTANPFNRDWYGGFVAGSYAYFVVMDLSATSAPIGVRVVRVCDNSNGTSISAMYEVYLDCLSSYDSIFSNARITGASLVSYPMSPGGPYEDTIVIGMVSPPFNAQFNITGGSVPIPGIWFSTWLMPGPVTRLTWTSGQNFIYAITNTSVVQVPIELCSNFTDCQSCAANVNPLCGWCTVEQKCSRRSLCQNSSVSGRWVQGSTSQCISITSVAPTKFISEMPTNINVTVTSGLPSPLTGESFMCLLSTGSGKYITVPFSNISQNAFTANISGAISQQNVPKLVVAAVCNLMVCADGCNVEKRCTAVTSSCSNAISISIPVGTTSMVANVSLIWTNNSTVMYQIDPLGVIQVSLYSCSKFSVSSCTSCLAINIGTEYDCGWCDGTSSCVELETCTFPSNLTNQSNLCPSPVLNSVSPSSGPFGGGTRLTITGTNLGVTVGDIFNVTVGGLNCSVQSDEYIAGTQIVCMTGNYSNRSSGGTPVNLAIQVYISGSLAAAQSNLTYILVNPSISSVFPKSGPIAGGTNVTIEGTFLNVGNGVKKVLLNGAMCKISQISLYQIACTSSALYVAGVGMVTVYIDNDVAIDNQVTFEYTSNPNYTSVFPARTIPAGGILLTFTGTYLNVSQKALLIINGMMAPCNQTFTTLKCYAPSLSSDPTGPNVYLFPDFNYTIVMDGAPGPPQKIEVVPNPKFTSINLVDQNQIIGSVRSISIMGTNVRNVELTEINVAVGGEKCAINPDLVTTSVLVGMNLLHNVGFLKYISSGEYRILNAVFPVAAVAGGVGGGGALVVVVLVVIVTISVMVHGRSSKRKNAQVTSLLMQMESMENAMAEECKRAFAELQIDLHDVANVEDKNYPFWDFRTFAIRFLFPTASDDHIVLKPVQFHTGLEEKSGLKQLQKFNHLLLDKEFLLTMIRTLEAQPGYFTLQDRCNFASMLIIVLQHELPYATDKSNPKLLLRRTESVAEKLLGNWLCFLLFPFILDHIGEPLFTLFRAIKNQLEKGPVDAITGEARNSLSEDKLLRLQLDVNVVEAIVDTENNDVIPIKLLASDTITQTKEKILDALFKNCPASKRPQLTDVDLQLKRGNAAISLCDQDESSERDGNWTKLNTLGHYKLDQMSELHLRNPKSPQPHFSLVPRHEYPVRTTSSDTIGTVICNMTVPSSEMSESCRVYHLIKPESAQSSLEGEQSHGNLVPEAFLTRLLATKRIIQPFVDDLFNAVFCIPRRKPLPKAVKYLFDFLDLQAADMGITDPEVVHTWKTNSLTLHFWVNVIVNPDFVFDIYKSTTVHSCLSVISRAYIDACSTSDINYSKDTSSSKLLYVNEVKGYKSHVQQYYNTIQSEPKMEKGELEDYIKESTHTTHQHFVTESALYELAKYGIKYSAQLSAALDENGLTDTAQTFKDIVKGLSP
eukprot:Em0001g1990a